MIPFGDLMKRLEPQGLASLGGQLITYQCHHHSLFLDRTIEDALGEESWAVRRQAAFEASHALLSSFASEFGLVSATERIVLATELFSALGHGRLNFDTAAETGVVRGEELHHGASFAEKYGSVLRNKRPQCAFAAGFVSAAATMAFSSNAGTLVADETECVARGDARCTFKLSRRPEGPRFGDPVTSTLVEKIHLEEPELGPRTRARLRDGSATAESLMSSMALGRVLHGVPPDESGVMRAFGARFALVPVIYTNQIAVDTVHIIEQRAPELFPLVASLVREAAQIGAFFMLGSIISSDAYRSEHGPPAADIEVRLDQLIGLTAGLGWGAFYVDEFVPKRSLVLKSPVTHESAYYALRHGSTVRSRLFFQQGLALAIMQLLHRVDLSSPASITTDAYDALFKSGPRYVVEETRSPLRGDKVCEVTVEVVPET